MLIENDITTEQILGPFFETQISMRVVVCPLNTKMNFLQANDLLVKTQKNTTHTNMKLQTIKLQKHKHKITNNKNRNL